LLCLDNGNVLTSTDGRAIAAFPVQLAYGQLNRTATGTTAFGGALQANWNAIIFGRTHQLIIGGAWDAGRTRFSADSGLGSLSPDRGFTDRGIIVDQPDGPIMPVSVKSRNDYLGIYAAERLDVTGTLSVTLSGRYNFARIAVEDLRRDSLSGTHDYGRLNAAAGLSYALTPRLSVYGGYAQANRAPTPAEFSCAAAETPCSLTNFFVADPALKQVTGQNIEVGLR